MITDDQRPAATPANFRKTQPAMITDHRTRLANSRMSGPKRMRGLSAPIGRVEDVSEQIPETVPFPSATMPIGTRSEVFATYLDYFRSRLVAKLRELPEADLRASRLPSGWTPLELLKHLSYMERRWLVWGFDGEAVPDPWGDQVDDRWVVADGEDLDNLVAGLAEQAARSRAIIEAHDLAEVGQPGERWSGKPPATLERVLFHVMQEYARHLGHLDVACELATGATGE
jgi:uncharacterized damage-inducible protein DinB